MHKLILSAHADKNLDKLRKKDKTNFDIVFHHFEKLTQNPKFYGKPLRSNLAGLWSCRAGDFRIVYEIEESKLLVFVVGIGHRKDIYDN